MISQPPETRRIGRGANFQYNHIVLTCAKRLARRIQISRNSRREGLFVISFFFAFHRRPIDLLPERRSDQNGGVLGGAEAFSKQVDMAHTPSQSFSAMYRSAQSDVHCCALSNECARQRLGCDHLP